MAIFFPILWMFLTSFKTEITAVATPPAVFFKPTLANYSAVLERADYVQFAINSVVVSLGSTLLALALAVPAAYSMAFFPGAAHARHSALDALHEDASAGRRPGADLPVVAQFRPARYAHRAGSDQQHQRAPDRGMDALFFLPRSAAEILEAGRMDGATEGQELVHILLPLAMPGIAATALLSMILCWNEAFWSLNLTTVKAATLTAFTASFCQPGGPVLGEAVGGFDAGDRAHPDLWVDRPAPIGARSVVRGGQVEGDCGLWQRSN